MAEKPEDEMTEEEKQKKREEITQSWLIGQKQARNNFNSEAYERGEKEKQLRELQEEIESHIESQESEKTGRKEKK